MAGIKLVVTGDVEEVALVKSFKRLFPDHDAAGNAVEWLGVRRTGAATTSRLAGGNTPRPAKNMKKLARVMLAEAWDARPRPSLVPAVDDVEIANLGRVPTIMAHVRAAFEYEIQRRQFSRRTEQRVRGHLRDCCSVHLLCPMVEAYFFGSSEALQRAGTATAPTVHLRSEDVEDFECTDPECLPRCHKKNKEMAGLQRSPKPWWREECHPKRYLERLVVRNNAVYVENVGGKKALKTLDWKAVPSDDNATPLIRSLFEDVADLFGCANPLPGTTSPHTYPTRRTRRSSLTLRNM